MSETLNNTMNLLGKNARSASRVLNLAEAEHKNLALRSIADEIRALASEIETANKADIKSATEKGLSPAMIDRLLLNPARIEAVAKSLEEIAAMDDPVGEIEATYERPNGLVIDKVKIPIGVIGMIYESRPNVTADAGALCLKSGNACILRGGSESLGSNQAIHRALVRGLKTAGLPETAIQLVPTKDRDAVGLLLGGLGGNVDMIIPRGGKSLIERVQTDARVPVLAHLEGLCHTYVHEDADLQMAQDILLNAKLRRTGVCGSTETLIVDESVAGSFLPDAFDALTAEGCEMRGDIKAKAICPDMIAANDQDFRTEHLAPILNIKVAGGLQSAIDHINHYGSGHTDSIITHNAEAAETFRKAVDSAIVMHNASTQFADGGEFGFGAEIGISTGRLHARGPVGAQHLTTFKYWVKGSGQVRPK